MAQRHQPKTSTKNDIAAHIILTLFCLILLASFISLVIDLTSAYVLIIHGRIHAGTGQVTPPRGCLYLNSRTLMEYPLAIVAFISMIWAAKTALKSAQTSASR